MIARLSVVALASAGAHIPKLPQRMVHVTAHESPNDFRELDRTPKDWDCMTDVLVIGTGYAGLAAAIEANDAGAQVIILEKMPAIGGNSIIASGGINAVDLVRQALDHLDDSIDKHYEQTMSGGDYRSD